MLCSRGLCFALSPFMDLYRPVLILRSEVKPVLHLQDVLDKLQHKVQEETEPFQTNVAVKLEKEGEHFGLTLDAQGFSPEELSVRQVGRKLRVSGKAEKKQEDGKGSYSYRLQEFRREFDLPEGSDPDAVSCFLAPDGKLHIQAARAPCVQEAERELRIKRSSEEETQQSVCSHTEETPGNTDSAA